MHRQTAAQRIERINRERKILDQIVDLQTEHPYIGIPSDKVSLSVHFVCKIIPIFLVAFDELTARFFQEHFTGQLILIFIVIEFWVTKNYTGRRMLGYRWFFGDDEYGCERLMFECRANAELVDQMLPKLFYTIQVVYIIIAWLLFFEAIFIIPNSVRIQTRKIEMNFLLMVSGVGNLFCFYMVSNCNYSVIEGVAQKQEALRRQLGIEELRKLQYGSIFSHY